MAMMQNQKTLKWIGIIVLGGVGLVILSIILLKYDAQRVKSYQDQAQLIGMERLQEECLKVEVGNQCNNLIGGAGDWTECDGKTCWYVYGRTDDLSFRGNVTVVRENDQYHVTDYMRDTSSAGN